MTEEPNEVTISIDGLTYRLTSSVLTAGQIRLLPHPPIEHDRDLWLVKAEEPDELLADEDQVALEDGLRLFTAPRSITAGQGPCRPHRHSLPAYSVGRR